MTLPGDPNGYAWPVEEHACPDCRRPERDCRCDWPMPTPPTGKCSMETDRIEYSDKRPLDVDADGDIENVSALLEALRLSIEPAIAHLGEFGVVMGVTRDGAVTASFGPNMYVDWEAVHRAPDA